MFDHIGIRVRALPPSLAFYRSVLEPLGFAAGAEYPGVAGLGPPDAPQLWLHEAGEGAGGAHLAFAARDRASVDAFHRAAIAAGARDNGAPGLRPDYGPTYYAAFVIDADGNNLEAVCLAEGA
jgi:catechol 2,3-dioxygenase-like lactoylglutathione lyase family enzyme